jgi:uncharacterized membrane protein SpoIIM required for sporulation
MRVVERLARREATWRELDGLLIRLESRRLRRGAPPPPEVVWVEDGAQPEAGGLSTGRAGAAEVVRLGELYRAACADLMLAEAYDLPRDTVAYLHALVARAHNAVYRARGFRFATWAGELFHSVPHRLRADPALRLSALVFYGVFVVFGLLAAARPGFAERVAGDAFIEQLEQMYAAPIGPDRRRDDALMAGFYIQHNASIGLQCYAWGLSFGLGTLAVLFDNAKVLGAAFGYMARSPSAGHFYTFVTAHGPFELTAIVFSGAAGLRLGWGLIDTRGQTRLASLRREAARSLPTVGAAVFLFVLAAFLEGFVSASALPYPYKAAIALVSAALLIAYLALGGRQTVASG